MGTIDELMSQIPMDQMAEIRLGVDRAEAERAVRQALPALVAGMQANAQDPSGAASLGEALGQHRDRLPGGVDVDAVDTDDGEKIVGHVFGQQRDQVVQRLGGGSGQGTGSSRGCCRCSPRSSWRGCHSASSAEADNRTAAAGSATSGVAAGGRWWRRATWRRWPRRHPRWPARRRWTRRPRLGRWRARRPARRAVGRRAEVVSAHGLARHCSCVRPRRQRRKCRLRPGPEEPPVTGSMWLATTRRAAPPD